jgi:sugar lactone lactonase YvrE
LVFPEAPRWHDGRLWLPDIHAHRVMRLEADNAWTVIAQLDDRPSGLGFLPDGTPLVVSLLDRRLLRLEGGRPSLHADLSDLAGDFINDMVVDGEGRAYVGNRNPGSTPENPVDTLILVQPDGHSEQVADRLSAPNRMAVTPDGGTLILAETLIGRLSAFAIGPSGTLSARRTRVEAVEVAVAGAGWPLGRPVTRFLRCCRCPPHTERTAEIPRRRPEHLRTGRAYLDGVGDRRRLRREER